MSSPYAIVQCAHGQFASAARAVAKALARFSHQQRLLRLQQHVEPASVADARPAGAVVLARANLEGELGCKRRSGSGSS